MRDFLRKKLKAAQDKGRKGVRVRRSELERVGSNMGLTPDESVELFESLDWVGERIMGNRVGLVGAWVTKVH